VEKLFVSDRELVLEFLNGNEPVFEEIVHRYKHKLYNFIFMLVKNQALAEDIFQDTFVKVLKSLKEGRYQDDGKFASWMMRIAHNLVIDHFRKNKLFPVISADDKEIPFFNSKNYSEKTFEEQIIEDQIFDDARKLLDYLPAEQKEVVIMRIYGDLSFKEIAEQTNVSLNTALGRMRYALINLRKLVAEKEICLEK
jgi:RNA polymerase sigma-70 factor (ECF subfamily)